MAFPEQIDSERIILKRPYRCINTLFVEEEIWKSISY